ncbi:ABC transporter permease [Mesorhizobium sp. B2-6-5]|uniref:ABC transporter permease n=1 Tax=Mesorhizobium sp. B2-6-5 TaxID=2589912 RepID=UPI0011263812|nr:ABC transporter permease [Mesorhizobium sp. B2-6-5]TPJ38559.1 ABC transporter permease [Mesorhizobium sp. B2-6-5]
MTELSLAKTSREGGHRAASRHGLAFSRFAVSLVLTFIGLTAVTFVIGRVVPIDPVVAIVGDRAPVETYERIRRELNLDEPVVVQYILYLKQILTGDLGTSVLTSQPIVKDLLRFFPATIELATIGLMIGVGIGVPLGVWSSVNQGSVLDQIIRTVVLVGYSAPVFWIGLVGLMVFYAKLGWVGGPGRLDFFYENLVETKTNMILVDTALAGQWDIFRNAVSHMFLPAVLLGMFSLAYIARMTRSLMLDQLTQEYIITARVKGISETAVIWRHAFRNVLVPLITVIVLAYAQLLEGAVLTETVFAWPGIGLYITNSLFNADINAVLGGTIAIGLAFVSLNLLSDLLYRFADPRAL